MPEPSDGSALCRFIAWLEALPGLHDAATLNAALIGMLKRFDAHQGRIEASFSFLLPEQGADGLDAKRLDYEGKWVADCAEGQTTIWAEVKVPMRTPRPCMTGASTHVARRHRCAVAVRVEQRACIEWHRLIRLRQEPNPVNGPKTMLEREEVTWVARHTRQRPGFVEDLVRNVGRSIESDERVGRYSIDVVRIHAQPFGLCEHRSVMNQRQFE